MNNALLLRELDDIVSGAEYAVSENDGIMIQIVSDSAEEAWRSVKSAVEHAEYPNRLCVSIYCIGFDGSSSFKDKYFSKDISIQLNSGHARNDNIKGFHAYFNTVLKRSNGIKYVVRTDKHSRFNDKWDSAMISLWQHQNDEKAVISLDLPDRSKKDMVVMASSEFSCMTKNNKYKDNFSKIAFESDKYYFGPVSVMTVFDKADLADISGYNMDDAVINGALFFDNNFHIYKSEEIQIWYQYINVASFIHA